MPLSAAGFGGGVVGPAWRDCAGACASTPKVAPTVVTPAIAAPFKMPRLLTVDALSRFDIESSRRFGVHFIGDGHNVASSESLSTLCCELYSSPDVRPFASADGLANLEAHELGRAEVEGLVLSGPW
jgi:hypothetical protein